jgi:threonyl-tRNA synthetase
MEITITLPDGSKRNYPKGVTSLEVAKSISEGLARNVLSAEVNGEVWDATRAINADASIKLLTWNDDDGKKTFWHSSAHLLAEAIESIYPGTKFGIGPPIEKGFYYDIDLGGKEINPDDFKAIEDKMLELAKQKNEFKRQEISKADAIAYFEQKGDEYKLDLIKDLNDGEITLYQQGNFTDLCRGPHIPDTGFIKAIKVLSIAGAYWRGDEKNKQLTRIYAVTFPKNTELTEYLTLLEEAKKRDHRKLGKQLGLFMISQKIGGGLPVWLPKGTLLRRQLENFLRKLQVEMGYHEVITPHIGNLELYKTSGHYPYYKDSQFAPIQVDDEEYMLKPMNCPHHHQIFANEPKSYRDLPYRVAEFGTVYRYEQSGELNGLSRVRGFTQDDAHIYCTTAQLKDEVKNVIKLTQYVFNTFGMDVSTRLSFRDDNSEKYGGDIAHWEQAQKEIKEVADEIGLEYFIGLGEAAFYGPKIDFIVKDALGRKWQLGTVQIDYVMPERFNLEYVGEDNQKHRPVIIHRAPFGSMERFISILIEHYAGDFPLWLSPDQCIVLPISDKYNDYAKKVLQILKNNDIRGVIDERDERAGKKIRDAEIAKYPYMLIVGEKEATNNSVSVRKHGQADLGEFPLENFIKHIQQEISSQTQLN